MNRRNIFKILIVIGVFLRLYQFGDLPASLNRDEAALGYNSWSISQYGIDEWGQMSPTIFKSFGDYKLPGYIYTLSPLVNALGLSEKVIRLPSLLAGISIIALSYFLARKFGHKKDSALFITCVVALSPWAIFYSRVGFEANLGLGLFLSAFLFLSSKKYLINILGLLTYAASILTYNTPLMLFPLLIIWIFISQKNQLKKAVVSSVAILLISFVWFISIKPLISQKKGITIFSDPSTISAQSLAYSRSNSAFEKLINTKAVYPVRLAAKNSISTFLPRFLVTSGGANPWHGVPDSGHMYWTTYLMFLSVLVVSISKMRIDGSWYKNKKSLPVLMILFGLLPAIVTIDAPHATRSLIVFLGITFLSAKAWNSLSRLSKNIIVLALVVETVLYINSYFNFFPKNHSASWQVGLKEAIINARHEYPDQTINITIPQNQPYIYTLIYDYVDPLEYVQTVKYYGPDSAGIEYVKSFKGWSFIGDIKDTPEDMPIIHQSESGSYILLSDKNQK